MFSGHLSLQLVDLRMEHQVNSFMGCDYNIELLFKEWKSYANLHAFDTAKVAIVEGLIWAAIAAAVLKRFLAHMTQLLTGVPMSTPRWPCVPCTS